LRISRLMRHSSTGEIRVIGDPDDAFSAGQAALVPILEGVFMPLWKSSSAAREALAQAMAISKSQAVIEFNMDGTIITANQNFLDTMGYRLDEIAGKHHRMFVTAEQRDKPDYHAFWAKLNAGEYQSAEYKRIGKGGR